MFFFLICDCFRKYHRLIVPNPPNHSWFNPQSNNNKNAKEILNIKFVHSLIKEESSKWTNSAGKVIIGGVSEGAFLALKAGLSFENETLGGIVAIDTEFPSFENLQLKDSLFEMNSKQQETNLLIWDTVQQQGTINQKTPQMNEISKELAKKLPALEYRQTQTNNNEKQKFELNENNHEILESLSNFFGTYYLPMSSSQTQISQWKRNNQSANSNSNDSKKSIEDLFD